MSAPEDFREAPHRRGLPASFGASGAPSIRIAATKDDAEAEALMHRARTEAHSVPLRMRAWSHRWLLERCIDSGLPMELRPRAERMVPKVVQAVGIAVRFGNPLFAPAVAEVRKAMEDVVLEADADGRIGETPFVKSRMMDAKNRKMRELFGTIGKGR